MKYIGSIFSLVAVIILPILFIISARKQFKIGFKDIVVGILSCFFFKILLNNALLYVLSKIPIVVDISKDVFFASMISMIVGIICTLSWLLVIYIFIYQRQISKKQIIGFVSGAIILEIFYVLFNVSLSNFVMFNELNNNTLESTLLQIYDVSAVKDIISNFNAYPTEYFYYFGIMALMILSNAYLLGAMLYHLKYNHSLEHYVSILLVIVFYAYFYFATSPLTMPYIIYILLILSLIQLYLANRYLNFENRK